LDPGLTHGSATGAISIDPGKWLRCDAATVRPWHRCWMLNASARSVLPSRADAAGCGAPSRSRQPAATSTGVRTP